MMAKLISNGRSRDEALDRLAAALDETAVEGVTTNLPFLRWLVRHPDVRAGGRRRRSWSSIRHCLRLRQRTASLARPFPAQPPLSPARAAAGRRHRAAPHGAGGGESTVTAPMPGTVIRVLAGEGDTVQARQPLLVLEAMKMETPLVAPYEAVVRRVHVAEGDRVAGGALLVELEEPA